jgi:hypothetical protein
MRTFVPSALAGCLLLTVTASASRAEEVPAEYRPVIAKALEYLAKTQQADGHWEATGGQHPLTMTALSGMAFLMEGSTVREGKYKDNIRRARNWLMAKSRANGMLGNPEIPGEAQRYMYGHGFAMLFLSCVYGDEDDTEVRRKLEDVLVRAAKFSRDAQTDKGGWGYVSAKENQSFDEGSVTITQVQALRAARNAGITVPGAAIRDAVKYLEKSTNAQGGVIYSLSGAGGPEGRVALTAAAVSCGFSSGQYYTSPLVKKWFTFFQTTPVPHIGDGRFHNEYTHYYFSQAMYVLGEDGYAKMFPNSRPADRLTWSKYRKETFDYMVKNQSGDGSWSGNLGPVYMTAVYACIMQLDNATMPIYQK